MNSNNETDLQGLASLLKYEPPLDITHKMASYQQQLFKPTQKEAKPSPEDILNLILPPRQWTHHGHYYLQYVSHDNPQREDVEKIKTNLQSALQQKQARTEGLCPIKQQLISQTFDQIIRQVTLNCPERGLMLLRVRDQRKMTIAAYQSVYEEGVSYGVTRQTQAQTGMDELEGQLKALQIRKQDLQRRKEELLSRMGSMQEKQREKRAVEVERRQYELKALRSQNEHLEAFLSSQKKPVLQEIQLQAAEEQS